MKEWTLMFYFAGDNQLAPVIVSQLKAIKDAGFHENIDVLVHFDPNEFGVPTRIYDVNRERKRNPKLPDTMIGDGADPFVRNMMEDDIKPEKINARVGRASTTSRALNKTGAGNNTDTANAEVSLEGFLDFCRENNPAKRYMLFLIGHGMVVGNDAFLPDENPVSSITLKKLGEILHGFTQGEPERAKAEKCDLELLVLHSCSMSAVEVAYQLKGTANYLMASEGPSFVGSWPYRQLLKKTFNHLRKAKNAAARKAKNNGRDPRRAKSNPRIDIQELVDSLYFLTLFNSTDFLLSGYSQDLALCSLDPDKFDGLTRSIRELVSHLKSGLEASSGEKSSAATKRGKRIKELVLLAHWEAQSYWGESYTDLFDFCRCLSERCDPKDGLKDIRDACISVMEKLDTGKSKGRSRQSRSKRFQGIVVRSENFGAESQYSHGLSIYFPWSRPIETEAKRNKDRKAEGRKKSNGKEEGVLERYKEYVFTKELGDDSWLSFLETYFNETKRQSRLVEDKTAVESRLKVTNIDNNLSRAGMFSRLDDPIKPLPRLGVDSVKPTPRVGADCGCTSIKNYPEDFVATEGVLKAFE